MRCVRLWPAHTHAYAPSRNSPCLTTVVQTHSRTEGAHWQSAPPPPAAPHVPSQMAAGATQLLMLSSLFLWPGLRPVKGTRAETTIAPRTLLRSYATPSCRSFSSRFACALCAFPRRRSARAPPPAASPAAAAGAAKDIAKIRKEMEQLYAKMSKSTSHSEIETMQQMKRGGFNSTFRWHQYKKFNFSKYNNIPSFGKMWFLEATPTKTPRPSW